MFATKSFKVATSDIMNISRPDPSALYPNTRQENKLLWHTFLQPFEALILSEI
jgi:hypothetical protein